MYTDKLFTGQRNIAGLGIYHYQSRFYSPKLGRFLSADSLVPNPFNPQDFNRYSYVRNNPVRYIDPSGHVCSDPENTNANAGCESGGNFVTKQDIKLHSQKYRNAKKNKNNSLLSITGGFNVSDNYPKTLAESAEDIYAGGPVELLDSLNERNEAVNDSLGQPNVSTSIIYQPYPDGSIDVKYIVVDNDSAYKMFVMNVTFKAESGPLCGLLFTNCSSLNQYYQADPTRITNTINSDKFMVIDPYTTESMVLAPSGALENPTNHFGPESVQSLTIYILFKFSANPNEAVVTLNVIP